MITRTTLILLFVCHGFAAWAQTEGNDSTAAPGHRTSSILGKASLSTPAGPLLPPRIGLRTYKLSANVLNSWVDMYLHNSLPTFIPAAKDSVQQFGNELLNQVGGVLNVAVGKMGYFGNGRDSLNRDIKGGQIDLRAGMKLVDPQTRSYSEFVVPTFQTSIETKFLIPLASGKVTDKAQLRASQLGNLTFRIGGMYQKILNSRTYGEYFKSRKGNPASTDLMNITYEISLSITNAFFISFGQSFGNIATVPNRTMFSFSYTAPPK